MEQRKDQRLLLLAMREVIQRRPDTGLILVGEGSLRPQLEDLVRAEELQSHVVFTGEVRQVERLYPLFDIYAQISVTEGISNSILEAMSCALPVVATDVGGNHEVVVDGKTGHLVPAGNKDRLVQSLIALLDDSRCRKKMGQEGLYRVQSFFNLEGMVTATQDLYEILLQMNSRRTRLRMSERLAIARHSRDKR